MARLRDFMANEGIQLRYLPAISPVEGASFGRAIVVRREPAHRSCFGPFAWPG